jgi:hypothetical protein
MPKTRRTWERTNLPRPVKEILWRLMISYTSYTTWDRALELGTMAEEIQKYTEWDNHLSRDTYNSLIKEIEITPPKELLNLNGDLREWAENLQSTATHKEIGKFEGGKGKVLLIGLQKQHIASLQELARDLLETYRNLARPSTPEEVEHAHRELWMLFRNMTGAALWKSFAIHMDIPIEEWEQVEYNIEMASLPWQKSSKTQFLEELRFSTIKAYDTLSSVFDKLSRMTGYSDTSEWDYAGLKKVCPDCPIQD